MILQTNLAIGFTIFIGIMNQVHYKGIVHRHDLVPIFTTLQNHFHALYNVSLQIKTMK
jgi:hypothetical protein